MRQLILLALPLLASCEPARVDCGRYETPATLSCMDKHEAKGERAMLLACLPFSQPEKVSGVWVTGFERNAFFEGRHLADGSILTEDSDTELVAEEAVRSNERYHALEVELTARRSVCPFTKITPHLIVADRMTVKGRSDLVAR